MTGEAAVTLSDEPKHAAAAASAAESNALLKRLLENAKTRPGLDEIPAHQRSHKLATITPDEQRQMVTVHSSPQQQPSNTLPQSSMQQGTLSHTKLLQSQPAPVLQSKSRAMTANFSDEHQYPWSPQLGISPNAWAVIPRRDRQQIYGANELHVLLLIRFS